MIGHQDSSLKKIGGEEDGEVRNEIIQMSHRNKKNLQPSSKVSLGGKSTVRHETL